MNSVSTSKIVKKNDISNAQIGIYGLGNFASQLSWTMVSSYLILFYTDVFGLATGAVAILMLVAKIWDGINDIMMGAIMERTHTRWGRFRPYIAGGAIFLVIFTVLTFTVPNFRGTGKLIYAYITYIGLGMSYTVTNVPYTALPIVMTDNPKKINRLYTAQMLGMTIGMIVLNLCTLPLVNYLGNGQQSAGYQKTATIFALVALPMFLLVAGFCKENITVKKENQPALKETVKAIAKNKNLIMVLLYTIISMMGMFGRIGVAVYFYLYCVQDFRFVTIFMMMQMIVGTIVMPFAPKVMEKIGKKNTCIVAMILQTIGMAMMFFGPYTNIPYLFVCHIVYGLGYIAGPCGSAMIVDSIDDYDVKNNVRSDGTAFAMNGLGTKIASAIGSALGIAVIGWFGYQAGQDITASTQNGINIASNLIPMVCYVLAIIPLFFYNLSDDYMDKVRRSLEERNSARN
ncbi:MFS transporter [uncultured Clostridium sp.]|uniref:MFS transporter n=1 Tax=uncultured Clostridium sp. TaxID=59620 RepID=UPI0025D2A4B6|nr:glycoside-pentoside-hexuronide (GPH):cation symporter [uncultured Clostridium sp.]MDU4883446.1 glycoside-pentoside-hexuronide (GPH):cation symporter [Clostridium celatum]MDU7076509.1 glycoside-pentoside-hexuronide (GPH):cation symporter [Clostridium celatum]